MLFSSDCRARKTESSDINNSTHPRLSLVNLFLSGIDMGPYTSNNIWRIKIPIADKPKFQTDLTKIK